MRQEQEGTGSDIDEDEVDEGIASKIRNSAAAPEDDDEPIIDDDELHNLLGV